MEKEVRMRLKALLIIAGLLLMCFFMGRNTERRGRILTEEESVKNADVTYLIEALFPEKAKEEEYLKWKGQSGERLTYDEFTALMQTLSVEEGIWAKNGVFPAGREEMHREEWYQIYDAMLERYDTAQTIHRLSLTALACGDSLLGSGTKEQEAGREIMTTEGLYTYLPEGMKQLLCRNLLVYEKDRCLLAVREVTEEESILANIWVSETAEQGIQCFYRGREIMLPFQGKTEDREQVADIVLKDGGVKECVFKKDKISGKLLRADEGSLEIEGRGSYEISEQIKVYKLYGALEELSITELEIGYENTDYIVEDGRVCACLVARQEAMEKIRVLIQKSDYSGVYHEKVELTADCDFTLRTGSGEEEEYKAGETVTVSPESGRFEKGDRVYVKPEALTGKIRLLSVHRAQGTPAYRGNMEIVKTQDGLAVINELLLEEYLYAVVPSEMPSGYPLEALKAQAVCARTYAYRNIKRAGIPGLGAHVDDSTGYQVYNNTQEHAPTTRAVKETQGKLLYYGEELVNAYYYSTSCGYGTDNRVWLAQEQIPYLKAKRLGTGEGGKSPGELTQEENFREFITTSHEEDYEKKEPWYRWSYEVEKLDAAVLLERLRSRYEISPNQILTRTESESDGGAGYISRPIEKLGDVKDIIVEKRSEGGNIEELVIVGTECTVKVLSEYSARYVLNDGVTPVTRQDGSQVQSPTLLPSAFCVITTGKEGDVVVGYTINGGGYGHGIGMSQNGARAMAEAGISAEEIVTFFYEGSRVEAAY